LNHATSFASQGFVALCALLGALAIDDAGGRSEGEFGGIRTGKTSIAEVQKLYGRGRLDAAVHEDPKHNLDLYYYEFKETRLTGYGSVEVDKKTGVVRVITLWGERVYALSPDDVRRFWGSDYVVVRFSPDPCSPDAEGGAIYEDPNGPLVFYDYRSQGVAVALNSGKGLVSYVRFGSFPLGEMKSRCVDSGTRQRDK